MSRKRKKKNWEDEDYYDSDDDTFLDRTGTVEKKRKERMKKAGKIEERPETYESLVKIYCLYTWPERNQIILTQYVFVCTVCAAKCSSF